MSRSTFPVVINWSIGLLKHVFVGVELSDSPNAFSYPVELRKPDGSLLLATTYKLALPGSDSYSLVSSLAKDLLRSPDFTMEQNGKAAELRVGSQWVDATAWLRAVEFELEQLIKLPRKHRFGVVLRATRQASTLTFA